MMLSEFPAGFKHRIKFMRGLNKKQLALALLSLLLLSLTAAALMYYPGNLISSSISNKFARTIFEVVWIVFIVGTATTTFNKLLSKIANRTLPKELIHRKS
ncbi:hypothetical protein ACOJQI_20390 [Bacillus salacetis]|uniref:hypothetical protein n=1 Tax=Bacillus salacetis TaxID=2315464 RepID=UPI003B9FC87E